MQEFSVFIKRPTLRIMGIEEGEEVKAKGIRNIFNNIITENFQNLEEVLPIQVQDASRTPYKLEQNRTSPQHIIIKTTSTENRERILKVVREKKQTKRQTHKNNSRFLNENLKSNKGIEGGILGNERKQLQP
jgi:hypothetical protein